jgi:hypothetical protein
LLKRSKRIKQQENKAVFFTQNLETRLKFQAVLLMTRPWQELRTLLLLAKLRKRKEKNLSTLSTQPIKQKEASRKFSS